MRSVEAGEGPAQFQVLKGVQVRALLENAYTGHDTGHTAGRQMTFLPPFHPSFPGQPTLDLNAGSH